MRKNLNLGGVFRSDTEHGSVCTSTVNTGLTDQYEIVLKTLGRWKANRHFNLGGVLAWKGKNVKKIKKSNLGGMQIDTQGRLEGNQHFPHFPKFQSTLHGQFGPKVAWQLPDFHACDNLD